MMLNRMYDTPIVVIIAAGPFTLRKGRRHSRSISHADHAGRRPW